MQRLYSIIQSLSIDFVAEFMKNNIVWTVLILATPLWIVGIAIINKLDKKNDMKSEGVDDKDGRMKALIAEDEKILHVSQNL